MSTTNRHRDDFGPITRNRSSSANEASKPILMLQRRQTHVGNKPMNFSPSGGEYRYDSSTVKLPSTNRLCFTNRFVVRDNRNASSFSTDSIQQSCRCPFRFGLASEEPANTPNLLAFPLSQSRELLMIFSRKFISVIDLLTRNFPFYRFTIGLRS